MFRTTILLAGLIFTTGGFAQDNVAKAKKILDKVSAEMDACETISVTFKTVVYQVDGDPISADGEAYLKGDKYLIKLEDQDIYCDGETVTTHLKEDDEAYLSSVDEQEEGSITPDEMLTIWETGHKYRYVEETKLDGKAVHKIALYPKEPGTKKYHTIIVKIDVETNRVKTVFVRGNDGTNMKYVLKKLTKNPDLPDSKFVFDCAKHPEVDCIEE